MSPHRPWIRVGQYLKSQRIECGLTQRELANHFQLSSAQYVSNWERGTCPPPVAYLPKLCELLKINQKQMVQLILDQTKVELNTVFKKAAWKR